MKTFHFQIKLWLNVLEQVQLKIILRSQHWLATWLLAPQNQQGLLLLRWFNFDPSMDK